MAHYLARTRVARVSAEPGTFGLLFRVLSLDFGRINFHRYYIIILFAMSRFGWDVGAPFGLFGAKMIVSFWP